MIYFIDSSSFVSLILMNTKIFLVTRMQFRNYWNKNTCAYCQLRSSLFYSNAVLLVVGPTSLIQVAFTEGGQSDGRVWTGSATLSTWCRWQVFLNNTARLDTNPCSEPPPALASLPPWLRTVSGYFSYPTTVIWDPANVLGMTDFHYDNFYLVYLLLVGISDFNIPWFLGSQISSFLDFQICRWAARRGARVN